MDYRILGPLEVVDSQGRSLALGGVKQRTLIAILLLHANQPLSTDRLVDELWGEGSPRAAARILHVMVSRCRKLLGEGILLSRPPGYALLVGQDELDLFRFESLVERARGLQPSEAAPLLREALDMWRGPPLADLASEEFAQAEVARLEEMRLSVLEERIDGELALGRHAEQVADLRALTSQHPYRERLRGQLMLALHRCGRQAEALEAYEEARMRLVETLGLEPGEALRALHSAILQRDPALGAPSHSDVRTPPAAPAGERSILVVADGCSELGGVLALAARLAAAPPPRELIVAGVLGPGSEANLAATAKQLDEHRRALIAQGVQARAAAFNSPDPAEDLARLASMQETDLVLLPVQMPRLETDLREGRLGAALVVIACDVALCLAAKKSDDGPVLVPFGGAPHDWGALELAAWVARALDAPLKLVGALADGRDGGRDASRLLADASLLVQRWAGIAAEPLLAAPGLDGVTDAARGAQLLVVGLSDRWQREGLGATRTALASSPPAPTLLLRRGIRPSGLAPPEARTRFTWSVAPAASA